MSQKNQENEALSQEEEASVSNEPECSPSCLEDEEQECEEHACERQPKEPEASDCHNKELGRRGELAAQAYLRARGYDIIETNWTCRFGEVDIIARTEDALHFIEVKTRSTTEFGFPSEAVTPEKRQRYEHMAVLYLMDTDDCEIAVSFDIISIVRTGPERALLRHHINAFSG